MIEEEQAEKSMAPGDITNIISPKGRGTEETFETPRSPRDGQLIN